VFIQIVDSLRCPNDHAETWLVASCDRMAERDILEGKLGCPICNAEFAIRDGAVWFDDAPARGIHVSGDEEEALRIAAFLELTDAQGFAILAGRWTVHAPLVSAMASTHLVLLNPVAPIPAQPGMSVLYSRSTAPFACGAARALACDETTPSNAIDAVAPGGRIIVPASGTLPTDVAELARDARTIVGVKNAIDSPPVPLTRRAAR
jgi:uncharacterized protein YbaR (Trm112 family)